MLLVLTAVAISLAVCGFTYWIMEIVDKKQAKN